MSVSSTIGNNEQAEVEERGGLRGKVIPVLTILLVLTITVILFLFQDRIAKLGNYGYLGAFLINLVSNATIILPLPGFLLIFALGTAFNPVLVGLASTAGGAIGEMTGYMLGYGGRGVVQNRRLYDRAAKWLGKWGGVNHLCFCRYSLALRRAGYGCRSPSLSFLEVFPCPFTR